MDFYRSGVFPHSSLIFHLRVIFSPKYFRIALGSMVECIVAIYGCSIFMARECLLMVLVCGWLIKTLPATLAMCLVTYNTFMWVCVVYMEHYIGGGTYSHIHTVTVHFFKYHDYFKWRTILLLLYICIT